MACDFGSLDLIVESALGESLLESGVCSILRPKNLNEGVSCLFVKDVLRAEDEEGEILRSLVTSIVTASWNPSFENRQGITFSYETIGQRRCVRIASFAHLRESHFSDLFERSDNDSSGPEKNWVQLCLGVNPKLCTWVRSPRSKLTRLLLGPMPNFTAAICVLNRCTEMRFSFRRMSVICLRNVFLHQLGQFAVMIDVEGQK